MKGAISIGKGGLQKMWASYERALHRRPVLTQCVTSTLLWGLGDTLAQRMDKSRELDVKRLALTASFGGVFMGPVGHYWYAGLDQLCLRLWQSGSPSFIIAKLVADTALFGPAYVIAFYAWGCALIDKSGYEGFHKKITKDFIPTYAAEMAVWPLFQAFNFSRVPVEHQLLAVNLVTVLDACFLSWARSQEDWVATAMQALKGMQQELQARQHAAGVVGGVMR